MTVQQLLKVLHDLPIDSPVYITDRTAIEVYDVKSIDVQHPIDGDEQACVNIRLDTEDDS